MGFDPTAWANVKAPDVQPHAASSLLQLAALGGQHSRANDANRRAEEEALRKNEESDKKERARKAWQTGEEAWIIGDQDGMQQSIMKMGAEDPKTASAFTSMYGTLDRANYVGASYDIAGALSYDLTDTAKQEKHINDAIAKMGVQHPFSQWLLDVRDMPAGEKRNESLLMAYNEAVRLRALPGKGRSGTKTPEQIQQELDLRDKEVGVKEKNQQLQRDKLKNRKEEYLADREVASAGVEKSVAANQDAIAKARENLGNISFIMDHLNQRVAAGDKDAGWGRKAMEWAKGVFGKEDWGSVMRKMTTNVAIKNAIQNLPPGVASDKDIELVLSGEVNADMNPEQLARYFKGMKRIQIAEVARREALETYIGEQTPPSQLGFTNFWKTNGKDIVDSALVENGEGALSVGDIVGAAGPVQPGGTPPASTPQQTSAVPTLPTDSPTANPTATPAAPAAAPGGPIDYTPLLTPDSLESPEPLTVIQPGDKVQWDPNKKRLVPLGGM